MSGHTSTFQADYGCQHGDDDMQRSNTMVFTRRDGKIFHFWSTELSDNFIDTAWVYWNLMDFTPDGRPDLPTPPQPFHSEFLQKHYIDAE